MRRKYQLSSGEIINCWYNDLGGITVMGDDGMEKQRFEFDRNSQDPTFEFNGEVVHINDFKFTPLDELITKVNKAVAEHDRWGVYSEEALATFMKEKDRLGFVKNIECFSTVVPGFGFALKGSDSPVVRDLVIPVEKQWKDKDWGYKMELQAENEAIREISGTERMYFDSIWQMIMSGSIEIVNRYEFRENHPKPEVIADKPISVVPC